MTNGEYVFYTIDMLPDEEILNPESIWKGNDGRDDDAKEAFQAVFHVSNHSSECVGRYMDIMVQYVNYYVYRF